MFGGRKTGRRFDHAGKQGRFADLELIRLFAEVVPRRGFDADCVLAKARPIGKNGEELSP